jgi:hypothetical protein
MLCERFRNNNRWHVIRCKSKREVFILHQVQLVKL